MADTLPFSEKTSAGISVLIQGVECGFVNTPLHNIYLSSDLVNGPVAVGIRQTLPFKGVHLLLGNDLAGEQVVVNSLVTDTPCMDQSPDPIEQELLDLYPSCAVTRAMAEKAMLTENQSDVDLTDSFIGLSFKNERVPTFYWLPKLHKKPYKARFIASSCSCTTTELSI